MTSAVRSLWWYFAAVRKDSCVCFAVLQKRSAALRSWFAVLLKPHCCTAKWYLLHCKVTRYTKSHVTSQFLEAALCFSAIRF